MNNRILWFVEVATTCIVLSLFGMTSCQSAKSANVNSICNDALVKQTVVIAAAALRNIPVQQYVDGMCKIAAIVEPFILSPLKPNTELGATAAPNEIDRSLEAARKLGLVK